MLSAYQTVFPQLWHKKLPKHLLVMHLCLEWEFIRSYRFIFLCREEVGWHSLHYWFGCFIVQAWSQCSFRNNYNELQSFYFKRTKQVFKDAYLGHIIHVSSGVYAVFDIMKTHDVLSFCSALLSNINVQTSTREIANSQGIWLDWRTPIGTG